MTGEVSKKEEDYIFWASGGKSFCLCIKNLFVEDTELVSLNWLLLRCRWLPLFVACALSKWVFSRFGGGLTQAF